MCTSILTMFADLAVMRKYKPDFFCPYAVFKHLKYTSTFMWMSANIFGFQDKFSDLQKLGSYVWHK